jgi:transposase
MLALLQPGLTRAALNDYRLGHILDALFAANLTRVFSVVALRALEVYAIPTPWLHQDTTTIALYGVYADDSQTPGAPRPAYGHSKDGRDDLKQVLLSLGVSGDGGLPLRVGVRDGNRSDSVETPLAIEECLALVFCKKCKHFLSRHTSGDRFCVVKRPVPIYFRAPQGI